MVHPFLVPKICEIVNFRDYLMSLMCLQGPNRRENDTLETKVKVYWIELCLFY